MGRGRTGRGLTRSGLALGFGLSLGCSLDWSIGPDASRDGAGGPDRGGSMGAGGSSGNADSAVDRTMPSDASLPDMGQPADAGPDVSCSALLATANEDLFAAQECTTSCPSRVMDPCGCSVGVAQASSSATAAYVEAVNAYNAAKCPPSCGSCPPKGVAYACVPVFVKDAGGLTSLCRPKP